jgi:hypothetical protein
VQKWVNWYKANPSDGRPFLKYIQLRDMINVFRAFCDEFGVELEKLTDCPRPEWLDNNVDSVLLDYWYPIFRAAEQHQSLIYIELLNKGYVNLRKLQDEMKARLKFTMSEVNIILYFDSVGKAKRYPFGRNYLIGIPLADAYRGDWLALPHELGHQIYWNAKFSENDQSPTPRSGKNFLDKEIDSALDKLSLSAQDPARTAIRKMLDDWTEEIFADVVGALVAREPFVEAAWDRIARRVEKDTELFLSDGEHPFPYLLPYIRAAALPANESYAAESYFTNKWQKLFSKEIKFTTLKSERLIDNVADPDISIADVLTAARAYVGNIRQRLTGNLDSIKMDKLLKGPSLLEELKNFLKPADDGQTGTVGGRTVIRTPEDEQKALRSLLTPIMLENNEMWTCRNRHRNSGDRSFCATCGVAHYWWNYLPFL